MQHAGYYVGGKRVPSVTTILAKFKDPGALMYWSWNIAYEVLQEAHYLVENPSDTAQRKLYLASKPLERANYRSEATAAATAGTLAHSLVEQWIHASKANRSNLARKTVTALTSEVKVDGVTAERALSSFSAFLDWARDSKFEPKATELRLISTTHMFGGTIDCIGTMRGKLILLDWKTSKGVYSDYLLQIAAYGLLYEENNPKEEIDSYHLCRFDKETGDYHHHQWESLDEAREMFIHFRACYDLEKIVSKRAS